MLRESLIQWTARALSRSSQGAALKILELFDADYSRGLDSHFIIGAELTNSGKPFLIHCWSHELFSFQLTDEQAARLAVPTAGFRHGNGPAPSAEHPRRPIRTAPAPISLDSVVIEHASALDPYAPIIAHIEYSGADSQICTAGMLWAASIVYHPGNALEKTAFHYPFGPILPSGKIDAQFSPMSEHGQLAPQSPVVLFAEICLVPDRRGQPNLLPSRGFLFGAFTPPGMVVSPLTSAMGLMPGSFGGIASHLQETAATKTAISDTRAILVDLKVTPEPIR
ncbi:MAG TPA: hypothetical protein VFC78_10675 [Tepidisphaeraceae bacterium]|nr:hypothetical protein [Tepidisphaeraceae bacterium]